MSYVVHRNETFFLGVCEDLLSTAHFCTIINKNFTEYSSNVILFYTNYIHQYMLTVSSTKIIGDMLFFIANEPSPSPPPNK